LSSPDSSALASVLESLPPSGGGAAANTPGRVPVARLNAQHPLYKTYSETWEDLAILYDDIQVRQHARRFLLKRPKELEEIYEARCSKRAFTYQNILSTGLGWYISKLFKEAPEIDIKVDDKPIDPSEDGGATSDDEWHYYEQFMKDCDRNGHTLSAIGQEIFRQALLYRRTYILIDLPAGTENAESAADQRIEPYLSVFDPRTALNWKSDSYGNLEWIVFHAQSVESEFLKPEVKVDRWYYFDRREYRVYEHREGETQNIGEQEKFANLVASGPHAMSLFRADPNDQGSPIVGRVPVVLWELPEGLWLAGRVLLQIVNHLNIENTLNWALFLQNLQMPVLKSDREVSPTISEAGFLQIEKDATFEYVGPDGISFTVSSERLACLREESFRSMYLQAQGRSSTATASAQSGYSKEMDMAPSRDVLNAYGTMLRETLQLLLYLVAQVRQDQAMDFDVRGLSYDENPDLNDFVTAEKMLALGIQSNTFNKEVQKQAVRDYGHTWNDDLKQKCCKEIDAAPTQTELLAQQQQLEQQQIEGSLNQAATRMITRTGNGTEADE
jgi:hypothetical protein